MAITALSASGVVTDQTGTSATYTLPTGIVSGTLLKMILTSDAAGQVLNTPPSGWTQDDSSTITNGDGQIYYKFSRVSDGTDSTTISVVWNVAKNTSAWINGYNGCDNSVGSSGAGERAYLKTNANSATIPTSPITVSSATITANAGDALVFMCGVDTNGNNGVYTTPSGFGTMGQSTSTDQFSSVAGAHLLGYGGGATGTVSATWTQSGNQGNFLIYFIALKTIGITTPGAGATTLTGQTAGRIAGAIIQPSTA